MRDPDQADFVSGRPLLLSNCLRCGTRLGSAGAGWVGSEGVSHASLDVDVANVDARRLYERLGYASSWVHMSTAGLPVMSPERSLVVARRTRG
jgi:hypothetical protein